MVLLSYFGVLLNPVPCVPDKTWIRILGSAQRCTTGCGLRQETTENCDTHRSSTEQNKSKGIEREVKIEEKGVVEEEGERRAGSIVCN
jgi:hypothetical protein